MERINAIKITLTTRENNDIFWLDEHTIFIFVTMVNNILFDLMMQCVRGKMTENIRFELDIKYENDLERSGISWFRLKGDIDKVDDWMEDIIRWFYTEYSLNNLVVHSFEVECIRYSPKDKNIKKIC